MAKFVLVLFFVVVSQGAVAYDGLTHDETYLLTSILDVHNLPVLDTQDPIERAPRILRRFLIPSLAHLVIMATVPPIAIIGGLVAGMSSGTALAHLLDRYDRQKPIEYAENRIFRLVWGIEKARAGELNVSEKMIRRAENTLTLAKNKGYDIDKYQSWSDVERGTWARRLFKWELGDVLSTAGYVGTCAAGLKLLGVF